jgi:hypothetical protein
MRGLAISIVVAVLVSGCSPHDPIDRLMAEVPYERVPSYMYVPVKLPTTAKPEEIVSALSSRDEFRDSRIKILEVRQTHTSPRSQDGALVQHFTAVLVDTVKGRKILLLKPEQSGWYYKFYDAK